MLKTYVPPRRQHSDDLRATVTPPFTHLGLITKDGKGMICPQRGAKDTLSLAVFGYALVQFWKKHYRGEEALTLDACTYAECSPGRVFMLDEMAIINYACQLELEGYGIIWEPSGGTGQFRLLKGSSLASVWEMCIERMKQNDYAQPAKSLHDFRTRTTLDHILARAHYHRTGSWRAAQVRVLAATDDVEQKLRLLQQHEDASIAGYLCLLIAKNEEEEARAYTLCHQVVADAALSSLALAVVRDYEHAFPLLPEEQALSDVSDDALPTSLPVHHKVLSNVTWYGAKVQTAKQHNLFELSDLASQLADARFPHALICVNELVNRDDPPPVVRKAIQRLIQHMIECSHLPDLGIKKYPPERGIYDAVLRKTGLHCCDADNNYSFVIPEQGDLADLWHCADTVIATRGVRPSDIYKTWRASPYGVKSGLHEILYTAYILSKKQYQTEL